MALGRARSAVPREDRQVRGRTRAPRNILIVPLMVIALGACATSPPPPPDPATQIDALEGRIFELVNEQRRTEAKGASDLMLDSELVAIARQKSADMAARDGFVTNAAERQVSATRLMAADAKFQGLLGENVASEGYTKGRGIDVENSAKAIVGSWLKSQSHRENLDYADYRRTGVGVALSGDTIFVTQLFATAVLQQRANGTRNVPSDAH